MTDKDSRSHSQIQPDGTQSRTIEIWKMGYFPFSLGGNIHRPIKTISPVGDPIDLGGGYTGYLIDTPPATISSPRPQAAASSART